MMTRLSCRTKDIDIETKFLSGMCQVFRGHSIVAKSRYGHFEWLAFDTDTDILILKSILSIKLCQVLELSFLILWLGMFFLVTCH